ncbi:hypothetical protein ERICV_02196 [Paenibacillus larvae subsp. larvae]|uniref:Uncharacterized protein n=1 Tax=Paenibacillus larvae subsp. larvae TaxID=147375 RepID=A0A6C0QRR7_9BACL|nr:hypothetical protein ERICV_01572 [Paenibacillus larvae subsp. larvae]QHZ51343.1 hypothetical protein ERICV_02196 [Paenibacillus larvae subsp. larvae]
MNIWCYPLMVDSKKRVHDIMDSLLLTGGDFSCHQRWDKPLLKTAKKSRKRLFGYGPRSGGSCHDSGETWD